MGFHVVLDDQLGCSCVSSKRRSRFCSHVACSESIRPRAHTTALHPCSRDTAYPERGPGIPSDTCDNTARPRGRGVLPQALFS
jgi:hypothetical protein